MSNVVKIPIESLEKDMVVLKFDKGGFTYAYYGRPLPDAAMIKYLERQGVQYAFVRQEADEPVSTTPPTPAAEKYIASYNKESTRLLNEVTDGVLVSPTINEMRQMMTLHDNTKQVATNILQEVRMGMAVDTESARNVVTDLVTNCIKAPEAFTSVARLKDFDNYTYTHSVNVAVLAIAISKRLGTSADEMHKIGLGALLHDIGKMRVPEKILNKPGKLTPEEFEIMKMHTVYGAEVIDKYDRNAKNIYHAMRHHHEKSDGTGYPDGLKETEIPRMAKVIAIADVYDAITSERIYHKGMMPSDALKLIFSWSGKHLNDALVKFFISIMGIYPVGTLVMLDSRELAIIIEPNRMDPVRPRVLLVSDNQMEPTTPRFFDLASYNVATQQPYKSIVSALDSRDFAMDTNKIIDEYVKANI